MLSYTIRRRLLAIGRSYFVDDPQGARVFRIAGKVRLVRTFSIKDAGGSVLYTVREKLLSIDPLFIVKRDGIEAATVKRITTSGATNDKFEIALATGETLTADGKLWTEDGVRIRRNGSCVAFVWREQLVIRERFFANIVASADQALFLAIAMSIVEIDPDRGNDST